MTDGRGFLQFVKTLIYYYCCYYDQKSYDSDGVRINNGVKYEDDEANFYEFNEAFHFIFHFGNNTEEYGNTMIEILKGYGVKAEKSGIRRIDNEEDWIQEEGVLL